MIKMIFDELLILSNFSILVYNHMEQVVGIRKRDNKYEGKLEGYYANRSL